MSYTHCNQNFFKLSHPTTSVVWPRWCSKLQLSATNCSNVHTEHGLLQKSDSYIHDQTLIGIRLTKSSMPSFFSCSTTEPKLDRRISGYVCSWRSFLKDASVYSLKHLPGLVRPARPARWCALACKEANSRSMVSDELLLFQREVHWLLSPAFVALQINPRMQCWKYEWRWWS